MVALNKTYRKTLTPDRSAKDSGHRFYSPEVSLFISPDPWGIKAGPDDPLSALYSEPTWLLRTAFRNNPIDRIDPHGLLTMKTYVGRGCNASNLHPLLGFWHTPWPKLQGIWHPGGSGAFSHSCGRWLVWGGVVCNTPTLLEVWGENKDPCCEKWLVRCEWTYQGWMTAPGFVKLHLTKVEFLLQQPQPWYSSLVVDDPPAGVMPVPGGLRSAWMTITDSKEGVVTVPYGVEMRLFQMIPNLTMSGPLSELREAASVKCEASCSDQLAELFFPFFSYGF